MSEQNKKQRSRTYARNRTNLSRRGFEKNPESDGVFLLKLIASFLAGTFWLKFAQPSVLAGIVLTGVPIGAMIGCIVVNRLEKRQFNRRIFYAVILMTMILSYFVPAGIVI